VWSALIFGGSGGLTFKHRVQRLIAVHDAWDPCTGGVFLPTWMVQTQVAGWLANGLMDRDYFVMLVQ